MTPRPPTQDEVLVLAAQIKPTLFRLRGQAPARQAIETAEAVASFGWSPLGPEAAALAARQFADTWAELLTGMPDSYGCTLTCVEAETAATLFRALGDEPTAVQIIEAHAAYDDEGDQHYQGASDGPEVQA